MLTFYLPTPAHTREFAKCLATELPKFHLLALYGDLGSGKTFICQALIQSLLADETKVTSPTFNILQTYPSPVGVIYHYDLYRIKSIAEIQELDLEEAMSYGISLIEWPEIIQELLPSKRLELTISDLGNEERSVLLKCYGSLPSAQLVALAEISL